MRNSPIARTLVAAASLALATHCGSSNNNSDAGPHRPAHTTLTPGPESFTDTLAVTLATDIPATVYVTTDGSDPHLSGTGRSSGGSPLTITLSQTTTLKYYSVTPDGQEEAVQSATYTRSSASQGSISGTVIVGTVAVSLPLALSVDGTLQTLNQVSQPGPVPFQVTGLTSGSHRLIAMADRDNDGLFLPVLDYTSDVYDVTIDLADPTKANITGVQIFLGTSAPSFATIDGTVTLPNPPAAQDLSITAVSPSDIAAGANTQDLLNRLQNGYRVLTSTSQTQYPYALTSLTPGTYVPIPTLLGLGTNGLGLTFIVKPLGALTLRAGDDDHADFQFGPVGISGAVSGTPSSAPTGIVYGAVAARHTDLLGGLLQGVLMPTVFGPPGADAGITSSYQGSALIANGTFDLRVFTSLDSQNPLGDALAWCLNPLDPKPAMATVTVGTSNLTQNLPLP